MDSEATPAEEYRVFVKPDIWDEIGEEGARNLWAETCIADGGTPVPGAPLWIEPLEPIVAGRPSLGRTVIGQATRRQSGSPR